MKLEFYAQLSCLSLFLTLLQLCVTNKTRVLKKRKRGVRIQEREVPIQNRAKEMVISRKGSPGGIMKWLDFFSKIFKHLENISGHLTNQMDHLLKIVIDM